MTSPDRLGLSLYSGALTSAVGDWDMDDLVDLVELGDEILFGPLRQLLSRVTGLPLSTWPTVASVREALSDLFANLSVSFDELVSALDGTYAGSDPALLAIRAIASGFRSVLGGGPLINFGQLTGAPINLLPSGSFDTGDTVSEGEGWSWDDTAGRNGAGSARFVGTGDAGILFSPAPAEVEAGKSYSARCWVSWDGVVAAGDAFTPFVRWADSGGAVLSETPLPAVTAPAAASSWTELAAEVTAPASARWAHLAFQVESGVLGTVWWDDAAILAAQQTLPQAVIAGLTDALAQLGADVQAALTWIKDLIERLTGQARATLTEAIGDALAFGNQLKTILSGGTVSSPLPNLAGAVVGTVQTMVAQIAAIASGDAVTPINSIVQSFKDGWAGLSALTSGVEAWIQDLIDAILRAIRKVPVVGGSLADIIAEVGGLNDRTDSAQQQAEAVQAGIVEGWTGGSTSGVDLDVYDTMGAIRALVGGDGYTRVNITSTQTWTKPAGTTEVIVVGVSSGQNGQNGNAQGSLINAGNGGLGGLGGGHKVQALDPSDFSALGVVVGTDGSPTQIRQGGTSGSILMEAIAGGTGAMATQFGYTGSNSQAGNGGNGGRGEVAGSNDSRSRTNGTNGDTSAAAASGSGGVGSNYNGTGGGAGGSVPVAAIIPCGGGGGGGGQGGRAESLGGLIYNGYDGGAGGAGGFPGGGGGGGGGRGNHAIGSSGSNGAGGAGGAGLAIIFYR